MKPSFVRKIKNLVHCLFIVGILVSTPLYAQQTLIFSTLDLGIITKINNQLHEVYAMNMNEAMSSVNSSLKGVVGLGMSLAVAFLVVDLLFPGQTNIVSNVATMISSFVDKGLVGLIALIAFVAMFSRN